MRPFILPFVLVPAFAQHLPPMDELVREALRNQARSFHHLTEYTYNYRSLQRQFDDKGKMQKETVSTGESYQSAKRNVDVEFARNGKAHNKRGVAKRQRAAAWQMQQDYEARRREKSTTEEREFGADVDGVRMETFATLRLCPLSNLRHDVVNGRAAFALDFGPAPAGTQFPRPDLGHLKRSRGTVWIDAEDRTVSQWKAWLVDGPPFFEMRYQRLSPKVWGVGTLHFQLQTFSQSRREWLWELTNPKRFTVEVEQKIGPP
jgi:hypothetical protein